MERNCFDLVTALNKVTTIELISLGRGQIHLFWFLPLALIRALGRECDLIHLGDGFLAPLGWLLSKIKGKPFSVTIHGLDITYQNSLYRFFVLPFIRTANLLVCNSANTRRLCMEHGCSPEKSVVIPCGIQVDRFSGIDRVAARQRLVNLYRTDPDTMILLSVGRLVARKGVSWFVREVLPALPGATLLVAGDGPEREELERAAAGVRNVRILGGVSDEILQELYHGSDAFVMPNIRMEGDAEGFGIVLLEAGLSGLFSVAADIDGIPEAVKEGRNGRLLESGNASLWIAAISLMSADRDGLRRMGDAAAVFVKTDCSSAARAQEYLAAWKTLCQG